MKIIFRSLFILFFLIIISVSYLSIIGIETDRFNSQISNNYVAGYFNTTSAIDEIQFKFDSGNIDTGTIKMYGVS